MPLDGAFEAQAAKARVGVVALGKDPHLPRTKGLGSKLEGRDGPKSLPDDTPRGAMLWPGIPVPLQVAPFTRTAQGRECARNLGVAILRSLPLLARPGILFFEESLNLRLLFLVLGPERVRLFFLDPVEGGCALQLLFEVVPLVDEVADLGPELVDLPFDDSNAPFDLGGVCDERGGGGGEVGSKPHLALTSGDWLPGLLVWRFCL